MNVESYLQGENPLQDDNTSVRKLPKYALYFMMVIAAGVGAQYGINKIQGVLDVGSDQTKVNVV